MEYRVAFDVTQSGYRDWTSAAGGLPFVAIGIYLVHYRELRGKKVPLAFGIFWLTFSVVWTIDDFEATYHHYLFARDALRSRSAQKLEGRVGQFFSVGMGKGESFVVAGRKFDYSDFWITGCFNKTSSFGGPIREGIQVRIWAVDDCIVKLEVAPPVEQ